MTNIKSAPKSPLQRMFTPKKIKGLLMSILRTVFIIGVCFVIIYPLLTKISISFMQPTDLYDSTVKAIPKHFTLSNYKDTIIYTDYFKLLFNSIVFCGAVSLVQMISCTFIGYGFARFPFKWNGLLFGLVVVCMVVPIQLTFTPLYLNLKAMGLINNFGSFFVLGITGVAPRCALYIYLVRQFFKGIPLDVDEAAAIDGAGPFKTFFVIALRSAIPIMVTVFLFSFVWQWGENSYSLLFYSDAQTLAKSLTSLGYNIGSDVVKPGLSVVSLANRGAYNSIIYATSNLLAIFPVLILYLFSQKSFIQSVERSGIVG
ncbi:MAG: carbohydrate ABC transporter permease [Oscillospiraceae bacterium]